MLGQKPFLRRIPNRNLQRSGAFLSDINELIKLIHKIPGALKALPSEDNRFLLIDRRNQKKMIRLA
jgi:hypothetical protein